MNASAFPSPPDGAPAAEAAAWVLRCDRGLTAAEQDALSAWLAADPANRTAFARQRQHWGRLDRLAAWRPEHATDPNPDLLAPPLRRRLAPWLWSGAAAAMLVLGAAWLSRPDATLVPERVAVVPEAGLPPAGPSQRVLPDGSIVELNRNAEITVAYLPHERRVSLRSGEALFFVAKQPGRPFVVVAQGVAVRAVGTAFNVRVADRVVEVLVTEGTVQVERPPEPASAPVSAPEPAPLLHARQRAVIDLAATAPAPQIATLTAGEIERVLAWQHRQLDFSGAPLAQIVAEFNRRNRIQLVVLDPELAAERISATFRSDNIEGFVRLLEAGFGARAERRGEAEIVLRPDGAR